MSSLAIRSGFCRSLLPRFEAQLPRVSHALFARHVTEARHFMTRFPTVRVNRVSRDSVIKLLQNIYNEEKCGICEKEGAEIFWFSPSSPCAHSSCYEKIKKIEEALEANLNLLFKTNGERNKAHEGVIEIVKQEIGDVSILSFLETRGEKELHSLFYSAKVADFLCKRAFK